MRLGIKGAFLISGVLLLTLSGLGGTADAQEPPLPTNRYVSKFPVTTTPAQYDLVQLVLDFAPGAFTRLHSHSGPAYVTVLEGQITRIENGVKAVFGPGQTFTEAQGVFLAAGNEGSVKARVMASLLLAPGGVPTINHPDSAAPSALPTTTFMSRTTLGMQPAEFELTHVVVDFGPGAYIPLHTHGGPGLVTVIQGDIAFTNASGQQRLSPGGILLDVSNAHDARNVGSGSATAIVSFLIRKGAPITSFVTPLVAAAPVTPPQAGDGGLLAGQDSLAPFGLFAGALAGLTIFAFRGRWRSTSR
jgi:quercetin dioxygenase-like cupin family protein